MTQRVLVVDDKELMRDSVTTALIRAGFVATAAPDGPSAINAITQHRPSVVITDLQMPAMDGLELLQKIRAIDDQIPVILMTAFATVETAVRAMKDGAFDYLMKPFEGDRLVTTVRRAVDHDRLSRENAVLKANIESTTRRSAPKGPVLVGRSSAIDSVREEIARFAPSQGTVLVTGESGVGKEVVSQLIHRQSSRSSSPMLTLNCAALSSSLLESELFGHEKGAFTGADRLRKGRFELADGGTLLLDEISEIPTPIQAKLLRVLQERAFERVGSSVTQHTDVRVIATTNRRLQEAVARGTFRQDLYFRLNVLPLAIPPLRDRVEDVAPLCEHFLDVIARREGHDAKRFEPEAIELLESYHWPGNVRELFNVCERASILAADATIAKAVIDAWFFQNIPTGVETPVEPAVVGLNGQYGGERVDPDPPVPMVARRANGTSHGFASVSNSISVPRASVTGRSVSTEHASPHEEANSESVRFVDRPLEEIEREVIVATLERNDGHRQRTAHQLGIGVRTLGLKLRKWKDLSLVSSDL